MPGRAQKVLTEVRVNRLKTPEDGERNLMDAALPGLGVRARAGAEKQYFVRYTTPQGQRRKISLGPTRVLSVAEARRKARSYLDAAREGRDLEVEQSRRGSAAEGMTVAEFVTRYFWPRVLDQKKPETRAQYKRILENYLGIPIDRDRGEVTPSRLASLPLTAVKPLDVEELIRDVKRQIAEDPDRRRPTVNEPGAAIANRTYAVVQAIFSTAMKLEAITASPAHGMKVERFRETKRAGALSPALMAAIGKAAAEEEKADPIGVAAIRLIALTGARRNEWLTARRESIDWKRKVLRLPDHKTLHRTGEAREEAAQIPLAPAALQILAKLEASADLQNPWVLQGRGPGQRRVNVYKCWGRILKRAGVKANVQPRPRLHDLRHYLASSALEKGVPLTDVQTLLRHRSLRSTMRYLNPTSDRAAAVAADVSSAILAVMSGEPAEVISFRRNK